MNAKQLAEQLNGSEYPLRPSSEIKALAKENGLVIVYGQSDDLIEFDGAIYDEADVYDGGTVRLDQKGLMPNRDDIDSDDDLEDYFSRKDTAKAIEALWCAEDEYSWTYKTDIPHETFDIFEDGERYCRGIVFSLSDL